MDNNFNSIAFIYDLLARLVFGSAIRKAQWHFLQEIPPNASILILGGGTGWILKKILMLRQADFITYIDASEKMLYRSKRRLNEGQKSKVNFILGDEKSIDGQTLYDVVITNFVLDLFRPERLNQVMEVLKGSLKKDGYWLFTDFNIINDIKRQWWQKFMLTIMYKFFKIVCNIEATDLPDFDLHFASNGLKEKSYKTFYSGFIISKVYYNYFTTH